MNIECKAIRVKNTINGSESSKVIQNACDPV